MTKRTRRNHSPAFTAKVALAALRGENKLVDLAQQRFDVHINRITQSTRCRVSGRSDPGTVQSLEKSCRSMGDPS